VEGAGAASPEDAQSALRLLFAGDPLRGERLGVEAAGFYLDYPTKRVTDETIALLVQLAGGCSLRERIDACSAAQRST